MPKAVELRRHTAAENDILTPEGVRTALQIGATLAGGYQVAVSSGAQRATQTLACFLAAWGGRVPAGILVDAGFRSEQEERWFEAARRGGGDLSTVLDADRALVEADAARFANALRRVFAMLDERGRALVVGHSPMNEAAVWGLTGEVVAPIAKGGGVIVVEEEGKFYVQPA